MTNDELRVAISTLDSLRRELLIKEGDDPADATEYFLNASADTLEIDEAEAKLRYHYSPLYRKFLQIHNGWYGFWPDWSLTGVRREDTEKMYEDIDENLNRLVKVVGREDLDKLPQLEKETPERILITNHPIIGTDFNGSFLVLDQNRIDIDGEPEIAWVIYLNHVERRWKTFAELLQNAIADTRFRLQD